MFDAVLSHDGSLGARDAQSDRESDHYGPGAGGKKRKVPAFSQALGRLDAEGEGEEEEGGAAGRASHHPPASPPAHAHYRSPRSSAAQACAFRKALFLRRKAAVITMYLDAQDLILKGTATVSTGSQPLPDVPAFEKLLPVLEGLGVSEWAPDRPGWRSGTDDRMRKSANAHTLGLWRTAFEQRQRVRSSRRTSVTRGWAPEGSFEFEKDCSVSLAARARARDRQRLEKLVKELRSIILSSKEALAEASVLYENDVTSAKDVAKPNHESVTSTSLSRIQSKESESTATKKKSKKKKKRSFLANQGNPHHMDNYRPSRLNNSQEDPYHPYPHHEFLLFPPSMRLLATTQHRASASPDSGSAPLAIRAIEDDFLCCFCEYDLSWGSEAARKRAIRSLKAERRRKQNIRNKAKDVADGKGGLKDDDEHSDVDDDDSCGDLDEYGRCTCDRRVSDPHRPAKSRLKPPETDPPNGDGLGQKEEHHHCSDKHQGCSHDSL